MPSVLHWLTAGEDISQSLATAPVPPAASMSSESVMPKLLGILTYMSIGLLTFFYIGCSMTTLSDRIHIAFQIRGGTKKALAEAVGVSSPAVHDWFTGKTVTLEAGNLIKAAKYLRVEPMWLATGQGAMTVTPSKEVDLENNPDYPAIKRVKFKLSAGASGFGIDYSEDDAAPIVFQRQWYERRGLKPDKLFAIKVHNSSMEPGLYDGDTVVVNTASTTPKDGVVFAVNYEGESVVKRLARDEGAWWLASDNPDQRRYARKRMTGDCFLIGEIVHKQSERI
jgi:phage repressor protein C with HTH and peptisase S24 domain